MVKPKRDRTQLNKRKPVPFNKVLIEAVNQGLKAILGKSGATVVLHHLKSSFSISMEQISEKTASFAAGLEDLFGKEGASIIEASIVEELYTKLGLSYQRINGYSFEDYVKQAEKK